MRRIFVLVCMIGSVSACVDLTKPEKVAECATKGTCVNGSPLDAGGGRLPDTAVGPEDDGGDASELPISDGPPPILADGQVIPADGPSDPIVALPDGPEDRPTDVPPNLPDTREAPRDVAVGICAPGGIIQPAGTPCRSAAGPCDVEETCDGVTADCPADKLAVAGKECRASAGDCDIAETCSGTSAACSADGFKQSGTICRAVAGPCDVAESCTGTGATCPIDSVAPATASCRASTDVGKCDPAETCTGTSVTCPADIIYVPPAVPVIGIPLAGTLQATISWSAAVGATGYNVKRAASITGGYTTLGSTPTTVSSPYLDKGLTGGTPYYYVVSSINTISTCESRNSSQATVTPTGLCTPPVAPTVTPSPANGIVTLNWAVVTGATSYSVARSLSTGTGYATIGTVTTGTTFTDSNVVNGTTYYYVVTAGNGSCSSGNSTEVSASPTCTPPVAITNLAALPGDGSIALTWTAPPTAVSYQILRSTTAGSGYTLAGTKGNLTGFTDQNVVNGTLYYYVVTASNGACSSTNSNQVSVTPACVPPLAPTGVTPTAGNGQVSLAWAASAGASMYRVSRNTTGTGTFTQIATPAVTSHLDTPLTNGTTYYYVVAASNGACWSADSAAVPATPVCIPPTVPGIITATAGDAKVTLSWVASTPAPASYTLQRKTGTGGTYATIASPTVASYTDDTPPLINDTTYYYQVSASNGSCSSIYNTEAPTTPKAVCLQTAPGNPGAAPTGSVRVALTWTAASPAPTTYNIGRSTSSTTGFTSIGSVAGTILTYTDTDITLLKTTTYYYQVTAVGATCTATAATVSATTSCTNPTVPSPTATNSSGAITITWPAVSGATAYTVSRSPCTGGTCPVISANQTAATYTDPASGLTNGTTYAYQVSASNANVQCVSAQSTAASIMSCAPAVAPTNLRRTVGISGQVVLNWDASTGATMYDILRSTTSGSGYASVGTSATPTFTNTGLANGTTYYYVVRAQNGTGNACVSGNSVQIAAAPNNCLVLSGTTQNADAVPNTTGTFCFITCFDIVGMGLANMADRTTFTVNGVAKTNCLDGQNCSIVAPNQLPAKDFSTYPTAGAYMFQVPACPAGSTTCKDYASIYWWGTGHDCL